MMVNHSSSSSTQQQQQQQQQHHQQQQHQSQQQQALNHHQQPLTLVGHNLNNANHLLLTSLSAMPNLLANPVSALNTNLISLNAQNNNSTNAANTSSSNNANQSNLNLVNMNTNNDLTLTSLINNNANGGGGGGSNGSQNLSNQNSGGNGNASTGLLDLIMCKLVAPFHVVNDPRLLECGSSACYQCIMSSKDSERNLKCPYCNSVHKIPVDSNKLIPNKNLQNFLKTNARHINSNFSKQLEDSMFALEQKIHSQNLSMENFDQYLTLIQNDVQMKVDSMKNCLEKYGQHFIESLKNIRKEVQKQWIDHSQQAGIPTSNSTSASLSMSSLTGNLGGKDKSFPLLGLKPDSLFQSNNNVMSVLNNAAGAGQPAYQLNSFTSLNAIGAVGANSGHHGNNSTANLNASNDHKHRNANHANHSTSNNFSNSSSWNANDDDLDDFDAELNLKGSTGGNSSGNKRHLNKEQAQFNKFVREEVAKKFGEDFLLQHEVNQLESSIMDLIKNEAISTFLPKDTTPARAWTLAKVSLRSLKRDLRRKQGLSLNPSKKNDSCHDGKMVHPYFDI